MKRGLTAGAAAVVVLVAAAYASGGLDRFVVSESAKSLRYRFEYWTATWRMLEKTARNLVVGVGPGNFRQNYLEFKLPQSSEEIADPHNLVLDVWANGGLIALAGLAGACFWCVRPLWSLESRLQAADKPDAGGILTPPEGGAPTIVGGAAAFLIVLFLGLADEVTMVLLLPAWLLVVLVCRPIFQQEVPRVVAAAAALALLVHLVGAGGIGMPAVTEVLLLSAMLAVPPGGAILRGPELPNTPDDRIRDSTLIDYEFEPRLGALVFGGLGIALYMACWFTGLMPIVTVRSKLESAREALFERGRPSQAERDFRFAVEFDPWSPTACERLSEMTLQNWLAAEGDRSEIFERCVKWQRIAIERDPRNPAGYRFLGEIYMAKAIGEQDSAAAALAVEAFERAAARYRNHAVLQSQLAEALWKAGKTPAARDAARSARDLNQINERAGHTDKRLPESRRRLMDEILTDSN
jgi:hypothetical protein